MRLSIIPHLVLAFGFGISPLMAKVDATSVAKDITDYSQLSPEKKKQLIQILSQKDWKRFSQADQKKVQEACFELSGHLIGFDSSKKHLKEVKDEGEKMILQIAGDYLNSLPPEKIPAHPSAGDLFGEIPANAPRVTSTITIDPSIVRWHSTGLYVAPGDVVTLHFPESWIHKSLKVQISGHHDHIPTTKPLKRLPAPVARSFEVKSTTVKVANAFGGAIYIDTGNKRLKEKPFSVKITNALKAPYFVLGKTKVSEWNQSLRHAPAPYAEFVTDRIALSFPSAWIRNMENPTELLQYWDHVVALHDELGGMTHLRFGPERVNVDVQILVGLFHAGYPTQGPQDQCYGMVDLKTLKIKGNWGWFHEMGHESQRRPDKAWGWVNPYTFDNSVETTVNLFTTHAMDKLKISDRDAWSWTASSDEVTQRAHKILSAKKRFPELGAAEKLTMYLQLRDQFGWESIHKMLSSYSADQDTHPELLPQENQAKRDAFLVRMSKATKHNLTPFLKDLWGINMSQDAVDQVKNLPVWIPKGFEKYLKHSSNNTH